MNKQNLTEKDKCPSCDKTFICSRSKACWCYEFDLGPKQLDYLEMNYDSCLCPDCMKDLSLKQGKFENID